ncbi:MAG: MFS transporter, partial [Hyphomicrobiales bacterium]
MSDPRQSNATAISALGITQIIGYGTLYYSFSILAPNIAAEFAIGVEWIYGVMSVALLAGGMIAPYSGALADRHGAASVLSFGSISAAIALAICGLANNAWLFLGGVILIELASAFVLYATAFALLAQATGSRAQRSITYLTLIAGFASTIFWPLTTWLLQAMDWHQIYFLFAGMNLLICLPLHLWLTRFARTAATDLSQKIEVVPVP